MAMLYIPSGLNGEVIWHARQCDQLVRLFFNIWPTTTMKINPIMQKFCQVDSTFCQIRNKPSKICRRLLKFCQNGEISPNLVTLMPFTPLSKELHLHVTNKSFNFVNNYSEFFHAVVHGGRVQILIWLLVEHPSSARRKALKSDSPVSIWKPRTWKSALKHQKLTKS